MNTDPGSQPPTEDPLPVAPAAAGSEPSPTRPVTGREAGSRTSHPRSVRWLHRIRRMVPRVQAAPAAVEPEPPVPEPVGVPRHSILTRNPFTIGFLLTLGALTAYALLSAFAQIRSVLFLVVLALFLALGLSPVVDWLHRRGLRRGLAVTAVALTLVALLGLAVWAIVPVANQQITVLVQNAPAYLDGLRQNAQIADLDQRFNIISKATEYLTSTNWITALFGGLMGAGQAVANLMFSFIITVVLTLYFLASMPALKEFIYGLAPASRRPRVRYLATEIFNRISGYLTGLFVIVTCTTTFAFLFMNLAGLGQYSLALGVLVALCAFIPLVGLTISMTVVSVVAFAVSPTVGLASIIYFLCYMQFDSYVIQPRVFQRSVNLPGVVAILAAVAGGTLYGLLGAILAVPTAAALTVLYQEVIVPALDRA